MKRIEDILFGLAVGVPLFVCGVGPNFGCASIPRHLHECRFDVDGSVAESGPCLLADVDEWIVYEQADCPTKRDCERASGRGANLRDCDRAGGAR